LVEIKVAMTVPEKVCMRVAMMALTMARLMAECLSTSKAVRKSAE
jgi:hypothetical protein